MPDLSFVSPYTSFSRQHRSYRCYMTRNFIDRFVSSCLGVCFALNNSYFFLTFSFKHFCKWYALKNIFCTPAIDAQRLTEDCVHVSAHICAHAIGHAQVSCMHWQWNTWSKDLKYWSPYVVHVMHEMCVYLCVCEWHERTNTHTHTDMHTQTYEHANIWTRAHANSSRVRRCGSI